LDWQRRYSSGTVASSGIEHVSLQRMSGHEEPAASMAAEATSMDPALTEAAAETVDAYLTAYRGRLRRTEKDGSRAFKNPEPNALLGLMLVWHGQLELNATRRGRSLEMLIALTRPLLEHASDHGPMLDICGTAWADAFGTLPIHNPPQEQLEWVLGSGVRKGAVSGIIGSAWRVIFLASSYGLMDWQHRRRAAAELDRWCPYLDSKLKDLSSVGGSDPAGVSVRARIGFLLAVAGVRLADDHLLEVAEHHLQALDEEVTSGKSGGAVGLPSAILAQAASANTAAGRSHVASELCGNLMSQFRNDRSLLIRSGLGGAERDEFSPWVPLALLTLLSDQSTATTFEKRQRSWSTGVMEHR
jgi:hypothetical protein